MKASAQQLWCEHPVIGVLGSEICLQILDRYPATEIDEGAQLFKQGTPVTEVCFLLAGAVCRHRRASDEREVLAHILEAPAVLGDAEAMQQEPHAYSAEALERCLVVKIEVKAMRQLLLDYPELARAELRYLSGLYCLQGHNEVASLASLQQRLANVLLAYAKRYGRRTRDDRLLIEVPLSLKTLCQSVGAVLRSVGHSMSDLRKQGLLERRGSLLVIDEAGLRAIARPIIGGLNYHAGMQLPVAATRRPPTGEIEIAASAPLFEGQQLGLEKEMTIGSVKCDLTLPDARVSPRHARIFRSSTGHRYWIQDLDSDCGTLVNGKAVLRTVLHDGDRIRLGETELVFHVVTDTSTNAAVEAA